MARLVLDLGLFQKTRTWQKQQVNIHTKEFRTKESEPAKCAAKHSTLTSGI